MNKAIIVKYLPQTGVKGARFRAADSDGNSKTIPYPFELSAEDRPKAAAIALCEKMKWDSSRMVAGEVKPGEYVYVDYARGMKLVDSSVVADLVDALERIGLKEFPGYNDEYKATLAFARAAIAKAKGE